MDTNIVLNGLISIVYVIFSLIIGLKIASKYKEYKQRILILAGLTWIGMSKPWWASSVSVLLYLINGIGISIFFYILISFSLISIIIFVWLFTLNDLITIKKFKIIIGLYAIYAIIFEILIFYFLFTDISVLGVLVSPVNIDLGLFLIVYLLLDLIFFVISGFYFAIRSLQSDRADIKLKGKFLFLAFLIYLIGAAIETVLSFPPARLILVVSAIMFYIGLMMPVGIKKRFLKEG